MSSRRGFLQATTSSLAVTGLSPLPRAAAAYTEGNRPTGLIDWHAHWIGPQVVRLLKARAEPPRYEVNEKGEILAIQKGQSTSARPQSARWFDLEERIRQLDGSGVERQVLSWVGGSHDSDLSPDEARPLWIAQNDDLAAAVRKYPRRLSGLATLPTANLRWAAKELDRAHRELGLLGATLPLDAFVSLEGARALAPIFQVAQRHRSHILVHRGLASPGIPGQQPEVGPANAYVGLAGLSAPNERPRGIPGDHPIARATLLTSTHLATGVITLALTDFLDAYPDVTVQVAMIGGSIPFVAEQIEFAEQAAGTPSAIQRLRRLYLDTGFSGRGPRGIALAARVFGIDRILFGSDYGPQPAIAPYVDAVQRAEIRIADKRAIFAGNGRALLAGKQARL